MDPNACFQSFIDAISENNIEGAYEAISNLLAWNHKGGFPAVFPGSKISVPADFVQNMAMVIARVADEEDAAVDEGPSGPG